jgi:hypothetical protein
MVLPLRFFVRGFGPPLLDAVEAVGRVAMEPDGGGVGAMLTVLAETVGIVAAAVCSTPVGSCEDLYWLSWDERPGNGDRFAIIEGFIALKILNICRSECEYNR